MVDKLAKTSYNTHIATNNRKHTMTHTTGLIRIVVGLLLVMGAVGGMDQQPDAPLLAQTAIAVVGLVLMLWAAVDINRNTTQTLNRLKD
jgi:di/tricarboxylate transporter